MDFVGGLPLSRKQHDYLYVVVDRFNKMCILMPCKKSITAEKIADLYFQHVWVHYGLPTSIVSDGFQICWEFLVQFMEDDGHQVEEEYCFPSANRWPNRGSENNHCTYFERLLQQALQALG